MGRRKGEREIGKEGGREGEDWEKLGRREGERRDGVKWRGRSLPNNMLMLISNSTHSVEAIQILRLPDADKDH